MPIVLSLEQTAAIPRFFDALVAIELNRTRGCRSTTLAGAVWVYDDGC